MIHGHGQNCHCLFCIEGYTCPKCSTHFEKNPEFDYHMRTIHPKPEDIRPPQMTGLDAFFGPEEPPYNEPTAYDLLYRGKFDWSRSIKMNEYSYSLLVMLR